MTNQQDIEMWNREPITLETLKWLLPGDQWQLVPNRVGNLSVLDPKGNYVGHVTFTPGQAHRFVLFEENANA